MTLILDPLEAVIKYLLADAELTALVGGRIAERHEYGEDEGGWTLPETGIQIQLDSGTPQVDLPIQQLRLEVSIFSGAVEDAVKVYRRIVQLTRDTGRVVVSTTDGKAVMYWMVISSAPSQLYDADLDVPYILFFLEAVTAEEAVP